MKFVRSDGPSACPITISMMAMPFVIAIDVFLFSAMVVWVYNFNPVVARRELSMHTQSTSYL